MTEILNNAQALLQSLENEALSLAPNEFGTYPHGKGAFEAADKGVSLQRDIVSMLRDMEPKKQSRLPAYGTGRRLSHDQENNPSLHRAY